jgi:hypothetical protein
VGAGRGLIDQQRERGGGEETVSAVVEFHIGFLRWGLVFGGVWWLFSELGG